jgi:hypothetical protein
MSVTNLIDRPVDRYAEDEPLGLSRYATALTDFIQDCETPITIGIQGDWGVGKTSLLNMVNDRLANAKYGDRMYPVIYFNTWQYAQLDQEDHLTVAMLNDIVERIRELNSAPASAKEKAGDILKSVGSMAASLGNQMVKSKTGVDVRQGIDEVRGEGDATPAFLQVMHLMVEYKQQFRDLVETFMEDKDERSRLVIMIDDLDRIRPARALDLLSSVKNFLDVPYCVFVLAVDYSVIQRGVEAKLGTAERKQHGKSYFDKIIQVPFNMPVSSYHVDRYIMSLLGWTQNNGSGKYKRSGGHIDDIYLKRHQSIKEKEAKEIENFTRLTVGKNPRSIKRAVNYFSLLKRVFDENGGPDKASNRRVEPGRSWQSLYLEILFGLSCFELAYPEVFEHFIQNPTPQRLQELSEWSHVSDLSAIGQIAERVDDIDDVKTNITGFFDQLRTVLDADDDWELTVEEFQPVWDVIRYANLSGDAVSRTDNTWGQIEEMVLKFAQEAGCDEEEQDQYTRALDLLKRSAWNNPLHLQAKNGGLHFFNLFWDRSPIGSITSTKGDPLQFYIQAPSFAEMTAPLSDDVLAYVRHVGEKHYGEGTIRVDLRGLLESGNSRFALQECLAATLDARSNARTNGSRSMARTKRSSESDGQSQSNGTVETV